MKWLLVLLFPCSAFAQQTVTIASLLHEMCDRSSVARYPDYTLRQASSYDRRSVAPDKPGWFANADHDQFIRTETHDDRVENVMLDADGPGAIVRFWLTTGVKPGTLRVYFDGADTPAIVAPAFDLMRTGLPLQYPHSSYEPEGKGGSTLYLPLPYEKHCKITFEYAGGAPRDGHYYQINYRTYPAGTPVETYQPTQLVRYHKDIDHAVYSLSHPGVGVYTSVYAKAGIDAGDTVMLPLPPGPRAIRLLAVEASDMDSLWIRIRFDGKTTVDCPIGDFIGSGAGGFPIDSWYRSMTGKVINSRWVMPYHGTAQVTFVNKGASPLKFSVTAYVDKWRWDDKSLYFHALFKYEPHVWDCKWDDTLGHPIDWNFASLRGRGVYMGNTLSLYNHMDAWYGEGDAKSYVDGETFPSEFGTGLEDYYNTSWAPVKRYQTPFANAPRADNPSSQGWNTFTRTLDLDAIPFAKSFSFDMEMLSWTGGYVDIGATTYWYGD